MSYINVGAKFNMTSEYVSTKKALREAIAADPANVRFYVTDAIGPNAGRTVTANNLDSGVKYTVVGPDPYTSRKWYATVEKRADGKVSVK